MGEYDSLVLNMIDRDVPNMFNRGDKIIAEEYIEVLLRYGSQDLVHKCNRFRAAAETLREVAGREAALGLQRARGEKSYTKYDLEAAKARVGALRTSFHEAHYALIAATDEEMESLLQRCSDGLSTNQPDAPRPK